MSVNVEDYIARIEEACGAEKDFIVLFKYDKKDEVIAKILKKAEMGKSVAGIIFDLTFKGFSLRLYGTGKAIFKKIKDKEELHRVLADLLL
ncbi:MAG: hypothetical protein ACPLRY_03250 [Candidatus Bathyarchaeales archaeon]